ncbi:MAG: hypothetical protein MJ159_04360 [Treponemataceae bacterium]|nr:hypothetical protein [Treponemataceae bacterium]
MKKGYFFYEIKSRAFNLKTFYTATGSKKLTILGHINKHLHKLVTQQQQFFTTACKYKTHRKYPD